MKLKPKYIIGIDEVGRGPLAGPITVAALALPRNFQLSISNLPKLKDSKKLSGKQREEWFRFIKESRKLKVAGSQIFYTTASICPRVIDRINITQAANLAATRALKKLIMKHRLPKKRMKIFLDGGLKIKEPLSTFYNLLTIIKGDEKIPAIALASIVAKVTRDKKMKLLHKKYPRYKFNEHKGYGTKKHFKALKKYGLSKIHRIAFIPKNICRKKH